MSDFTKLYDANASLSAPCSCGGSHSANQHTAIQSAETLANQGIESAMMRALFPDDSMRRGFLKAVGANTAMAAIASVLPIKIGRASCRERVSLVV